MTDQYAVFGNPIKHSRSPQIHRAFAVQTEQDIHYVSTLVEPDQFQTTAKQFFDTGGKGLNITVPFKQDAFAFVDQLSERARRAGAVNTLIRQDDSSILGENTDGIGLRCGNGCLRTAVRKTPGLNCYRQSHRQQSRKAGS